MKISIGLQPQVNNSVAATATAELLSNGDFASGGTGWTYDGAWTFSGGTASVTDTLVNYLSQSIAFVNNASYVVTFTVVSITAGSSIRTAFSGFSGNNNGTSRTSAGTYSETITASGSPVDFVMEFTPAGLGGTAVIDNISLKRV